MNSQQLYYIIIPMRFLNFLFILYWLLKDKNNFNIHIYIYTIYRYTIYTLMHIHTYNYKYHKYNIGDRKHFLWHTTYFLYKYFPLQQIYIYITKAVPTDLRKPTICTVTRWTPCSLLLHTVSKLPCRFKYLLTFPPHAMSQLQEDGHYRCRRRMTSDIGPVKYEGWKRSLEGSAVTKDPWNMSGISLCGLQSSGWHDDSRWQMGGEASADSPAAWPLPIKLTGLFLSEWPRCSETRTDIPQTPRCIIVLEPVFKWCYDSALALVWALQGKYSAIGTTMVSFSTKTRKEAADLKKILYPKELNHKNLDVQNQETWCQAWFNWWLTEKKKLSKN